MKEVDGNAILILLTICLRSSFVCGTKLDAYNFTVTHAYPLGEGKWRAVVDSGSFRFPGQMIEARSAYVLVRFGVTIHNYMDYLAGTCVSNQCTNSKWLISSVGYQADNFLEFKFQFDHNVWFGNKFPTGDCALFTSLAEAHAEANSNPDYPQSIPANPHLAVASPMSITSSYKAPQMYQLDGTCNYVFNGYAYGPLEAYSFISFGASINLDTYYDYQGKDVVMSDPLAGFVIVRMKNGATNQDQISFRVDVLAATSAIDVECDLYIGYSAAESAAFLRYPTTSVASPTTSVAAPTTSIAAPTTATTAAKTPSCTVPVSREHAMYEVEEARDKIIEGAFVWDVTTFSLLSCFRKCLEHDDCVAFGWQPMAKQCKGFRNITALYSPASPIKSQLYCT